MFVPLLHYRSKFEIYSRLSPEDFSMHLFDSVKPDLEKAYMNKRWRHKMEYEFSGTFYRFIWNGFNRFNGVKKCSLRVDKKLGQIIVYGKYEFTEIFLLCLIFSIIPLAGYTGEQAWRIITLVLIWLVYLLNFFISYIRLNKYFKEKVKNTFLEADKTYHKKLL